MNNHSGGKQMPKNGYSVVDLFCGAGGLSSGFVSAGFNVLKAIDHSRAAAATYEKNLGSHVEQGEITESTEFPEADVIIGGPPCQGFSSAGLRRAGDERNSLVSCFARLICKYRPAAFVFENVEGFLTAESGDRVFDLLSPLVEAGYKIHLRKVNAANYGVPQHRKRVVAVGGLGWSPTFPDPTHFAFGAPGAALIGAHLPKAPTLRDVLASLPEPALEPPGDPQGHFYRPLEGMDLVRAEALEPGQTMRDLPQELWHESFTRRAFRRVMDGTPTERRGGPPAGIKRLRPDEPSKTITSGAVAEFLHPFDHRPLTLRECAAIQTFPNHFILRGSLYEQAVLVGNAVPPQFAAVLASTLLHDLQSAKQRDVDGELLSFVPTVSTGMSPALKQLTDRVQSTFLRKTSFESQKTLWL